MYVSLPYASKKTYYNLLMRALNYGMVNSHIDFKMLSAEHYEDYCFGITPDCRIYVLCSFLSPYAAVSHLRLIVMVNPSGTPKMRNFWSACLRGSHAAQSAPVASICDAIGKVTLRVTDDAVFPRFNMGAVYALPKAERVLEALDEVDPIGYRLEGPWAYTLRRLRTTTRCMVSLRYWMSLFRVSIVKID